MRESTRLTGRFMAAMGLVACGADAPPVAPVTATPLPAPAPAPMPTSVASAPPAEPAGTGSTSAEWRASFPRRKMTATYCSKTESASCVEGPAELSKCPASRKVECIRVHRGTPVDPAGCTGELLSAVSLSERKSHPAACCYDLHEECMNPAEGRPLRAAWSMPPLLAKVTPATGASWVLPLARGADDAARARRWTEAARAEHASIASFAKLSLDLMAHGAPADLVVDVHRAAMDEVEHARSCAGMAVRFGGSPIDIGPLPVPAMKTPTLAELARETFRDGCIGETAAAIRARGKAATAADDVERTALLRIADDEERHAELGWRILAWAATQDPVVLDGLHRDLDLAPDPVRAEIVAPCLMALITARQRPSAVV